MSSTAQNHPHSQQNYWDSVSDSKTFTTPFQADTFASLVRKDAAVLDVGCGYGRTLDELWQQGYRHLTGIDFSEGMISRGHALYPYLDLRHKPTAAINFPGESFDAVILFAVLTCIVRDEEQQALIDEIRRVLRPGGILYVNDFLLNTDERNRTRYAKYQDKYGTCGVFELPEGAVLRHQSEDHVRDLLSDFSTEVFSPVTFRTMNGHTSNGFCFFGRKS